MKLKERLPEDLVQDLGISQEDLTQLNQFGYMPLTKRAYNALKARKDLVASIRINEEQVVGDIYPLNARYGWTRDNYGPVWIPQKGKSIKPGRGKSLTLKGVVWPWQVKTKLTWTSSYKYVTVKDGKVTVNKKAKVGTRARITVKTANKKSTYIYIVVK